MVPDIHTQFHIQPFIMPRAIWRQVFGHTNSLTQNSGHTDSQTIKPPTVIPVYVILVSCHKLCLNLRWYELNNTSTNCTHITCSRSRTHTLYLVYLTRPYYVFCLEILVRLAAYHTRFSRLVTYSQFLACLSQSTNANGGWCIVGYRIYKVQHCVLSFVR